MQLVYWYIFWIVILIIAILLVSFPGWGRCEGWFQRKLIKNPDVRWLYIWSGIFILLGAVGYLGDPNRGVEVPEQNTNALWQSSYRFLYGFLLVAIFLWWFAFFGGRNPAVAIIAGLFGAVLAASLAFLVPQWLGCVGYIIISIWMLLITVYSFQITQLNLENPNCVIRFF